MSRRILSARQFPGPVDIPAGELLRNVHLDAAQAWVKGFDNSPSAMEARHYQRLVAQGIKSGLDTRLLKGGVEPVEVSEGEPRVFLSGEDVAATAAAVNPDMPVPVRVRHS